MALKRDSKGDLTSNSDTAIKSAKVLQLLAPCSKWICSYLHLPELYLCSKKKKERERVNSGFVSCVLKWPHSCPRSCVGVERLALTCDTTQTKLLSASRVGRWAHAHVPPPPPRTHKHGYAVTRNREKSHSHDNRKRWKVNTYVSMSDKILMLFFLKLSQNVAAKNSQSVL